ncbi:GHKL domain-containing protein [Streptococcus suis]|uniref:GHKL domain-containing protein n=1 Tax=Streptococcus suis TaxID=1307 RepID=UPI00155712EF|nr:GHKL domain-containing protein [Streptococcus suis]MBS8100701.1 GHKL domain-containing protein [Streptococcus suis]NQJ68587.1 GHKL domain-containing protein [Streptococcus suis]NQJ72823.1 GHKL domain-containing protein [Streptococcus suis]NQJ76099.1 GHKL domain-containing protein [Streptococcus suis]NRG97737.1 GHKL domain-containing protein [Streptococcus suis]
MSVSNYIIEAIVSLGSLIVLFFSVNRLKYSIRSILLVILIRLPVAALFATLNQLFSNTFFAYFDIPLYGLLLAIVFLRPLPKTILIFYALLPFTLNNLFYRMVNYFVLPLFGQSPGIIEGTPTFVFVNLLSTLSVLLFLGWLRYDFVKLRTDNLAAEDKRILYMTNWVMFAYYLLMQTLTYLEYDIGLPTMAYRQFILVIYLVIFMGVIKQLDLHLREKIQEQFDFQQALQLKNLEDYSNQIEELYREVRGFRHDYSNLLTTLRLGIEENDMVQIKDVYQSVLKDSHKQLRTSKYDIGRLVNIDNSALKSLLASKFLQANDNNVSVSLEVPEVIKPQGMELVDFITIVSILCDNAIDAAIDAATPKVTIAFLTVNDKQMFIIENNTKEERVDLSELYAFGHSSKGEGRGIGLYNVMKILELYPHVSLNTTSASYLFCQSLEIGLTSN